MSSTDPKKEALATIYQCARTLLSSGDPLSAVKSLISLHEAQPENPDYLNDLGVILAQMGRADVGLDFLMKASSLAPTDDNISENLKALQNLIDPGTIPEPPTTLLETLKLLADVAWTPDIEREKARRRRHLEEKKAERLSR